MPGSDLTSTHKTARTDSEAFSPEVVNKYWGIVIFCVLAFMLCSMYLYSVVNTALIDWSRSLRLFLATHMYVTAILAAWAYWLTHRTAPPKIPSRFHFTDEEWRVLRDKNFDFEVLQDELNTMARKRGIRIRTEEGKVNTCKHCCLVKPERTHHCSVCKVCVAKMDHHCPWFGNCVHFSNLKFFLQAIFYSVFGIAYMLLTSLVMLLLTDGGMARIKATDGAMSSFCILCFIGLGVGVPAGGFLSMQLHHAMKNMSTLESMKGTVYFVSAPGESYDLGSPRLNLEQQLGPVLLAWFIPVNSTPGDGTQFLVRSDMAKKPSQSGSKKAVKSEHDGVNSMTSKSSVESKPAV